MKYLVKEHLDHHNIKNSHQIVDPLDLAELRKVEDTVVIISVLVSDTLVWPAMSMTLAV